MVTNGKRLWEAGRPVDIVGMVTNGKLNDYKMITRWLQWLQTIGYKGYNRRETKRSKPFCGVVMVTNGNKWLQWLQAIDYKGYNGYKQMVTNSYKRRETMASGLSRPVK